MGAEPVPQVCSGCRFKLEETCATGRVGVPVSLNPREPINSGVQADVVASPVILSDSEHLGVGLPPGYVGVDTGPQTRVTEYGT